MSNEDDGPPCCMDHFLMARRLVEAGARVVTISFGRWDTHSDNFRSNRIRIPKLDMALSALVEDLYDRGLDRDVSVIVWGEFGARRDQQKCRPRSLACGQFRPAGGRRDADGPGHWLDRQGSGLRQDRPVSFQNVFATLYHNLGIDPATAVSDRNGRPMILLDERQPIHEAV